MRGGFDEDATAADGAIMVATTAGGADAADAAKAAAGACGQPRHSREGVFSIFPQSTVGCMTIMSTHLECGRRRPDPIGRCSEEGEEERRPWKR